jgi:hypothetical protein
MIAIVDERLRQDPTLLRARRPGRDFYLYFAAVFLTVRALIREARTRYRWDTRPTTRRLK